MEEEQLLKMAEQVKKNMRGKRYHSFDAYWENRRRQS